MNIGRLLSQHAKRRPDKLAFVFGDQRFTYLEYSQNVNRLANALLDMGIRKGDKVATLLPNCVELLEVYWAVARRWGSWRPFPETSPGKCSSESCGKSLQPVFPGDSVLPDEFLRLYFQRSGRKGRSACGQLIGYLVGFLRLSRT